LQRYRLRGDFGHNGGMQKKPLSAIERLARMVDACRAERMAKRDRAQAEYDRITARLRCRPFDETPGLAKPANLP